MGPRTRRRLDRIMFWRLFDPPQLSMIRLIKRDARRMRGAHLWRAYTRLRRDLYPDSVEGWEVT